MALPKAYRLKHRQDFSDVFRKGIRRSTANLTLRAVRQSTKPEPGKQNIANQANQPEKPSRIGITVSQKVSKRAVIRNRIKRQIRAAFRQLLPRLKFGWLLVVIVKPEARQCDYHQFLQELEQLLAEAEVLNGHSRGSLL